MAEKLKILGLGFKLLTWKSLTAKITKELEAQGGQADLHLVPKGWGDFLTQALKGYDEFKADIILISQPAFHNLQGVTDFYQGLLLNERAKLPSLWLVTKSYGSFISEVLEKQSGTNFFVKNLGEISLNSADQIKEKTAGNELILISPAPKFHLKGIDEATCKQINEGFIPASAIGKVIWQEQEFTGPEFFDLQAYLLEEEQPLSFSQGFIKENGQFFLRGKINPRHILSLQNQSIQLDQLSTFADLKSAETITSLVQEAKARLVQKWSEAECRSLNYLKSFTPIAIVSNHRLAAKMMAAYLQEMGLNKALAGTKSPFSLHVFLTSSDAGECPYFLDLSGDGFLQRTLTMPDLGEAYFERKLPPDNAMGEAEIDHEKQKVKAQIHMLFERQKGLTGKKVMAEQERGLIHGAREKAQLLVILAQKIEIIENSDITTGEDSLIFYDDPAVASSLSRQLTQGGGRSHFVDLSQLESMTALLEYDTAPLLSYCDQGRVYASHLSQKRLLNLMSGILDEIPINLESEPQMEEKALELEGTALYQALDELSYLTLWNQIKDFTQIHLNEVLAAAATALPQIEQEIFKLERPRKICLFAIEKATEEKLQHLASSLFEEKPKVQFIQVNFDLKSESTDLEATAVENATALKDFFEQATYDLVHGQPDFILLELEMELLLLLVGFLRKTSQLANTPIMALATGWISEDTTKKITDHGVKILYEFSGDLEYLSKRLRSNIN